MDHSDLAPALAADALSSAAAPARARKPRRCTADYRWTQPKVIAFLEALSRCGQVAEAARAVGMSRQAAYDLRARLNSPRFDAAFEGARRTGIRARAAASRTRLVAARSIWEGPGIAEMAARHAPGSRATQADTATAQADIRAAQTDTVPAQPDTGKPQVYAQRQQADGFSRKPTKNTPGPCNTRSMSQPAGAPPANPANPFRATGSACGRASQPLLERPAPPAPGRAPAGTANGLPCRTGPDLRPAHPSRREDRP
jgi:hypothetical protein